jgi:phosphohistidine phosphatase
MAKTIIFMRHGKAADIADYDTDFDRPLVKRGKEEAALAAEKLKIIGIVPDTIIASPARRTQDTARSVCKAFGKKENDFITEISLYGGGSYDYLQAAGKAPGKTIMVIGHNPDIGNLAIHFSNGEINAYPTSACAAFRFQTNKPDSRSIAELLYYDLRK